MVTIKQSHLVVAFIVGIAAPLATGISSYYKTVSEIREGFVRKEEFREVSDKLNRIAEDLAEIKGELKEARRALDHPRSSISPKN